MSFRNFHSQSLVNNFLNLGRTFFIFIINSFLIFSNDNFINFLCGYFTDFLLHFKNIFLNSSFMNILTQFSISTFASYCSSQTWHFNNSGQRKEVFSFKTWQFSSFLYLRLLCQDGENFFPLSWIVGMSSLWRAIWGEGWNWKLCENVHETRIWGNILKM